MKRTSQQWQTIIREHAKSSVSTREFWRQHNIHVQASTQNAMHWVLCLGMRML